MKKTLKYLAIFIGTLIVVGLSTCAIMSKKLPTGIDSPKTEVMVTKMWKALNKEAWDTTRYVKWTFPGQHEYIWDKTDNLVQISWKNNRVLLDPDEITGNVYVDNVKQSGEKSDELISEAWTFWCNDMFWLTAPFKVKDSGTSLTLIEDEKGDRLKVSYISGGTTPGDSYIWIFDKTGMPIAFELYTSILPIQGVNASWEEWITLPTGAKLASNHKMAGIPLVLDDIQGGNSLSDIGLTNDIWKEIR